ncbi:hypothetical protein BLNAU_9446 [Blattamonas nauphoetae]|uniref:Uncharacterized protein n=1 Tax=Blattamonas nauphoetae TaxID=2049346 RepID=A0ABQ9XVT5_9EUKA|nr:hypothetical protein BLNAU_9446 [Blattamonas nauphoetae]
MAHKAKRPLRIIIAIAHTLLLLGGIASVILGSVFYKHFESSRTVLIIGIVSLLIGAIGIILSFLAPKNRCGSVLLWISTLLSVCTFPIAIVMAITNFNNKLTLFVQFPTKDKLLQYAKVWNWMTCAENPTTECIYEFNLSTYFHGLWIPDFCVCLACFMVISLCLTHILKGKKFIAITSLSQIAIISALFGAVLIASAVILLLRMAISSVYRPIMIGLIVVGGVLLVSAVLKLFGSCFNRICLHTILIAIDGVFVCILTVCSTLLVVYQRYYSSIIATSYLVDVIDQYWDIFTVFLPSERILFLYNLSMGTSSIIITYLFLLDFMFVVSIVMSSVQLRLQRRRKYGTDETQPLLQGTNNADYNSY